MSVEDASLVRMEGLLKYEDLIGLLTCVMCRQFCGSTIVQCRKGHVICRACKANNRVTSCRTCKQNFVDAPNVVLDKLMDLIALPCRFRASGCAEFVFADKKLEHETLCSCRPIACQYASQGCTEELPYKALAGHHRLCKYNPRNANASTKKK